MKFKAIITILILSICTINLSGCFDLGGFFTSHEASNEFKEVDYKKYYSVYYDNFDDITMYKEDKSTKDYDLQNSFFNRNTINKLAWENSEDEVEYNNYLAMEVPFEKDTKTQSLALYLQLEEINSDKAEDKTVQLFGYVLKTDDFDEDYICKYSEDPYDRDDKGNIKVDVQGNKMLKDGFKNPKNSSIASFDVSLVSGTWSSFTCKFSTSENNYINVEDGESLVVIFYNNTGFGNYEKLKQCKFRCTNLLIRSIN